MSLPRGPLPVVRRWTIRNRPPFVEAYPVIGIGDCHRQARLGRDHLLWRDRGLRVTGAAAVRWAGTSGIELRYRIEEGVYLDAAEGGLVLAVAWKGSMDTNQRPFARCPLCDRHVDVLAFVDRWSCRACHGLTYRSALLPQACRWSEEVRDLDGAIAAAEAGHADADRAHRERIERRDLLMARLDGRPVTANALLLSTMTAEWVRPLPASLDR